MKTENIKKWDDNNNSGLYSSAEAFLSRSIWNSKVSYFRKVINIYYTLHNSLSGSGTDHCNQIYYYFSNETFGYPL